MEYNIKFIIAKTEALLLYGALWFREEPLGVFLLSAAVILATMNLVDSVVN